MRFFDRVITTTLRDLRRVPTSVSCSRQASRAPADAAIDPDAAGIRFATHPSTELHRQLVVELESRQQSFRMLAIRRTILKPPNSPALHLKKVSQTWHTIKGRHFRRPFRANC